MRNILKYGVIGIAALAVAMAILLASATSFTDQWFRRDIELRSNLVANAVRDLVGVQLAEHATASVTALFERLAQDERLLAVGYCDPNGRLLYSSKQAPADFTCEKVARSEADSFSAIVSNDREIVVAAFPLNRRLSGGHLVILHDFGFAERRARQARLALIGIFAAVFLGAVGLAILIAFLVMRDWLRSVRKSMHREPGEPPPFFESKTPLGRELAALLRELRTDQTVPDGVDQTWTPDSLRTLLQRDLPGAQVIVVSNREPYIHVIHENGTVAVQRPASGLVSALEPIMRACGGTWIAHGSGSADAQHVDANDRVAVPPGAPNYTLRRVWLTEEEQDGYYYGFANEGLWPLCHIAFVRPEFRQEDWKYYRAVNQRFADAVVAEARQTNPIVLVQDYHFALLPKMIRQHLPNATIVTFWHIPWPNAESFGICPWKDEIIEGLLGASILGFHTQFHCNNFMDTVDRFVESRIDREHASITLAGHETFVRPFPISIEWPPAAMAGQEPVEVCRSKVRNSLGLPKNIHLGVGIERFDYTKGILDRMKAVDFFLTHHPEWRGRFVFLQAAAPTRSKLPAYQALQSSALALAEEINQRHRVNGVEPIRLQIRHHEPDEVFELFRAADICMVSSLHDGMNLVAKEFVAARDDGGGVLVLSGFTGASRELSEALLVNPYDAAGTAEAIHRALTMPAAEQHERMRLMRDVVRSRNVYRWAGRMLLEAARLRSRKRIETLVSDTAS